jgi:hypothetical protein
MHSYLQDTEFATQSLFRLATDEEQQLLTLRETLAAVMRGLEHHDWDFRTSDLHEDFSDVYVMAAHARMAKTAQKADQIRIEVTRLEASIANRQHSVQAIAGAILQIAKQGISLVHGELDAAPPGRTVGTLAVRDIVWQARNQSMHYEDKKPFNKWGTALFATLANEHGEQFNLAQHPEQNRAKQVLDVLGWNNYAAYLDDMIQLLHRSA